MTTTSTSHNTWTGLTLTGRKSGPYRIAGPLAQGGMAFILRATDTARGVEVVVKLPKPHLLADDTITKRFAREIQALLSFEHPHVVPLLDQGDYQGLPFLVMPLLSGGSLRDRGRGRAQPVSTLRDWLPAVADALDAIHAQKTLHRDVKPDNILFDKAGVPHVTDFGIVKGVGTNGPLTGTQYTSDGGVLGTVPYMAAELCQGHAITGRTDQFALAATVYEWLTGRVPFDGATSAAVFVNQLKKKTILPNLLSPDVSKELAAAIMVGLSLAPADRYPDCRTFAAAVLDQLPATAPPPPRAPLPATPRKPPPTTKVSAVSDDTAQAAPIAPPPPKPTPPKSTPAKPQVAVPLPPIVADEPLPLDAILPLERVQAKRARPIDDGDEPDGEDSAPEPSPKRRKSAKTRSAPEIPIEDLPKTKRRTPREWWVRTTSGTILGPYDPEYVRELLDTGRIQEYHEASWNQKDWKTLGMLAEFGAEDEAFTRRRRSKSRGGWWVVGVVVVAVVVALALFLLRK